MYDLPEVRWAHDALWDAIAARLRDAGVADVPAELTRDCALSDHWASPDLLLSQTCGYPLVTRFAGRLTVIATPVYRAPGCEGPTYRSAFVVAESSAARDLSDLRGAVCAVNERTSHSGMNALRAAIAPLAGGAPFFREVRLTGAHVASVASVQVGEADVCAIDAVTHALLARHRPAALEGTRVLGLSTSAPALPYVTRARASAGEIASIRDALAAAIGAPELSAAREALLLERFEPSNEAGYARIAEIEAEAIALGYADLA